MSEPLSTTIVKATPDAGPLRGEAAVLVADAIVAADWPFEHLGETQYRHGDWPLFFGNVVDDKPPIDDQRSRR